LLVVLTAFAVLLGSIAGDSALAYVAPHGLELSGRWSVETGLVGRQYWQFTTEPGAPANTSTQGSGPDASLSPTVTGNSLTVVETYYSKQEYPGAIVSEHPGLVLTLHGTLSLNSQGDPEARGTFTSSEKLATNAPPEEAWGGHDLFLPEPVTTPGSGSGPTTGTLAKCVVPHLKGKKLAAAEKALLTAHCAIGRVKKARSTRVKNGTVISQGQAPGKSVPSGTRVSLVVSKR
jgi:hypothetical protein